MKHGNHGIFVVGDKNKTLHSALNWTSTKSPMFYEKALGHLWLLSSGDVLVERQKGKVF